MENKRNSIASSILNFLLQLLGVALFYWLLIYTTIHYWMRGFIYRLAKLRYEPGPNFTKELYLLLLILVVFCYLANRFLLDVYHRSTIKQFILSTVADYFLWPLQLFIMLKWNNAHMVNAVQDVSTLYNVYVITALLVLKNLIALKLMNKGDGVNSKTSSKAV